MLRSIVVGTLLCAGAAAVAYADVYRWVDEHGIVHYTDQWVPGAEIIKATKPHPTNGGSDSARSASNAQTSAGAQRAAAQLKEESQVHAVQQDVAKVRAEQCKEAKDRYEKAIIAKRIYKQTRPDDKDEDRGADREYLSDAEADAYRLKARQQMDEVCGPGAASSVDNATK